MSCDDADGRHYRVLLGMQHRLEGYVRTNFRHLSLGGLSVLVLHRFFHLRIAGTRRFVGRGVRLQESRGYRGGHDGHVRIFGGIRQRYRSRQALQCLRLAIGVFNVSRCFLSRRFVFYADAGKAKVGETLKVFDMCGVDEKFLFGSFCFEVCHEDEGFIFLPKVMIRITL